MRGIEKCVRVRKGAHGCVRALCLIVVACLASISVHASGPGPQVSSPTRRAVVGTARFFGGAATGLVGHELGHVAFGATFGAHPSVKRIDYGPIPFFAIAHQPVSRRKEFVISAAGMWSQQASAEWLLAEHPNLRDERSPFLKGVFAFHLATSVVYGVAGFGRIGPPERDTRGLADSLGRDGIPEPAIGALVLAPAVFDGYRYLRPNATWAKWASRATKVAGVALTLAAGR
jgi:hypothetical protein